MHPQRPPPAQDPAAQPPAAPPAGTGAQGGLHGGPCCRPPMLMRAACVPQTSQPLPASLPPTAPGAAPGRLGPGQQLPARPPRARPGPHQLAQARGRACGLGAGPGPGGPLRGRQRSPWPPRQALPLPTPVLPPTCAPQERDRRRAGGQRRALAALQRGRAAGAAAGALRRRVRDAGGGAGGAARPAGARVPHLQVCGGGAERGGPGERVWMLSRGTAGTASPARRPLVPPSCGAASTRPAAPTSTTRCRCGGCRGAARAGATPWRWASTSPTSASSCGRCALGAGRCASCCTDCCRRQAALQPLGKCRPAGCPCRLGSALQRPAADLPPAPTRLYRTRRAACWTARRRRAAPPCTWSTAAWTCCPPCSARTCARCAPPRVRAGPAGGRGGAPGLGRRAGRALAVDR